MGWCHSTQKSCTQTYFTLWQHAQHLRQDWAMFSFFCVVVSIAFLSTYGGRYLLSSSTCNRSFFCVIKIHSHWIISICKRLFCISTSPAEEGKNDLRVFSHAVSENAYRLLMTVAHSLARASHIDKIESTTSSGKSFFSTKFFFSKCPVCKPA